MSEFEYDAIVIGSGPNGLAAAITLARAGYTVQVMERNDLPGGGTRTRELTLPGFHHDVCSAVHPMAVASPFFQSLELEKNGVSWRTARFPVAHPLGGDRAAAVLRSVEETAARLGKDGGRYRLLVGGLAKQLPKLVHDLLGPAKLPRHPITMTRFGLPAILPAKTFARLAFRGEEARALFAGNAAHSIQPLENVTTSAIGLILMACAHAVDWPVPVGGSAAINQAMVKILASHGGKVSTGVDVKSLRELPSARVVLFDTDPLAMARIAGNRLPDAYVRRLQNYRFGPGVFKVDWALSEPIPWSASDCREACTVHVGGTLEEIAASERDCWEGRHSDAPYVLVAQQSLIDDTRAPAGQHTAWAYCHVPRGSTRDMTAVIERQIERFAPGFGDTILGTHTMNCADFEEYNPNYVGGDIISGVQDWRQLFTRPVARLDPYSTPDPGIFLCSSSTPPGGGVHGMCGHHAAQSVLRRFRRS